ncbi:MAG: nrfG [Verrucomicrobiaceae bacterium]|nr:nrfG [Verrucomicrobiaceae bacterium]
MMSTMQRLVRIAFFLALAAHVGTSARAQEPPRLGTLENAKGARIKEADLAKTGALPASTKALADRAARAFSKQDWPAARKAYREMLQSEPENALAWANLGAVEQQAGNGDAAAACFEASVRFNPQLAQSWLSLGLLYSNKADRYRALSCFARALHEDPVDARAHNYLAIEAKNLGWIDTALSELQRAIELNADYGIAHFNLATIYLEQKPPSLTLAQRHYTRALELGVEKDEVIEQKLKGQ